MPSRILLLRSSSQSLFCRSKVPKSLEVPGPVRGLLIKPLAPVASLPTFETAEVSPRPGIPN